MKYNEFKLNDFENDLRWSELPAQYVIYMQAIVYWWPMASGWDRITNVIQQKQGKDITLDLPGNQSVKLQFKARRVDYKDLCIEYRHDFYNGRTKPGWIEIESEANYLLYCVPQFVYRLDYKALHYIWRQNKDAWIQKYNLPPAQNQDYKTRNVGIPFDILENMGITIDRLHIPEKEKQERQYTMNYTVGSTAPLWPRHVYEDWVKRGSGTKDQIARYKEAIAWYKRGG